MTKETAKLEAVAIDGPAGAGKSTVSRELARRLGFAYLDTGAMYRAVTLRARRALGDLERAAEADIAGHACSAVITFRVEGDSTRVLLDGEDVTSAIREPDLTRDSRYVARSTPCRKALSARQRELALAGRVVMEGRDIGTVVMPEAAVKFWLDASIEERARRRAGDLERAGQPVDMQKLRADIAARDESDRSRETGPMKPADDAEVVDTTGLGFEEVVSLLERLARARLEEVLS